MLSLHLMHHSSVLNNNPGLSFRIIKCQIVIFLCPYTKVLQLKELCKICQTKEVIYFNARFPWKVFFYNNKVYKLSYRFNPIYFYFLLSSQIVWKSVLVHFATMLVQCRKCDVSSAPLNKMLNDGCCSFDAVEHLKKSNHNIKPCYNTSPRISSS